ncbi:MAG TPA: mechanosensitive ion channel domain-containing protein [Verrucomicrobiae bacterium]
MQRITLSVMNTNGVSTNSVTWIPESVRHVWGSQPHIIHIAIIIGLAFIAHVIVKSVRHYSEWMINRSHEKRHPFDFVTQQPKFITLTRLIVSAITFAIYALAILFIVLLFDPNGTGSTFKTYLTSAAVVGLALSFGLQGLVQDVVTCVTLILSDAMDVGDTVDLMNGVIGRVERIGLRFTKVINFYNQEIFVPNRNINNVSRFPHGGVLAYADVQIPAKADQQAIAETIQKVSKGVAAQFNAIILGEPAFSKVESTPGGWSFMRVRFNIWPGQNSLIETTFRAQMVSAIKTFEPAYTDWQVVVTYRAMAAASA